MIMYKVTIKKYENNKEIIEIYNEPRNSKQGEKPSDENVKKAFDKMVKKWSKDGVRYELVSFEETNETKIGLIK